MSKVESFPHIKSNASFAVSLRFELFYSLLVLTDPESRIHKGWKQKSARTLGNSFFNHFESVGGAWQVWPALSTLLPVERSDMNFDQIIEELQALSVDVWKEKLLAAMLHFPDLVESVLKKGQTLKNAINKAPQKKQEWLSFVGLFPYDSSNVLVSSYETLIQNPKKFKKDILLLLQLYWTKVFQKTWSHYLPALKRSVSQKELLFASCSFEEFSREMLLRVELDSGKNIIKAVRGGFQIKEDQIRECIFSPSAFNDKRFWSALKSKRSKTEDYVFFPYFDPALQLDLDLASAGSNPIQAEIDSFLVFKALGDTTRFAIAMLIAKEPQTATELAQQLDVSKPTISHHLEVLRSAGLLSEEPFSGSVRLHLQRKTIEQLSEQAIFKFFDSDEKLDLSLTRRKSVK